jgi:DNA gyrase/topoisomerase IV subunit A
MYRFTTIRRRTAHRLAKLQARDHIVQGLSRALQRIDDVIQIMKTSPDAASARSALMDASQGGFSLEQVWYGMVGVIFYLQSV